MSDHFDPLEFDPLDLDAELDTAHLDQLIRRRLSTAIEAPAPSPAVLDDLRRPLRRARLVHQTHLVASAAAVIALVAGASQLVVDRSTESTLIAASKTSEVAAPLASDASTTIDEGPDQGVQIDTAVVTTGDGSTPVTAADGSVGEGSAVASTTVYGTGSTVTNRPNPTTSPTSTALPTTVPATSGSPATTKAPATTATTAVSTSTTSTVPATTSTTVATTPKTISTSCGSITATASGRAISLVGTQPKPGFTAHVDNDGPEELEVKLSGSQGSCEIKATARGGVISAETSFESSSDDDGEHDD